MPTRFICPCSSIACSNALSLQADEFGTLCHERYKLEVVPGTRMYPPAGLSQGEITLADGTARITARVAVVYALTLPQRSGHSCVCRSASNIARHRGRRTPASGLRRNLRCVKGVHMSFDAVLARVSIAVAALRGVSYRARGGASTSTTTTSKTSRPKSSRPSGAWPSTRMGKSWCDRRRGRDSRPTTTQERPPLSYTPATRRENPELLYCP